MTRSDRMFALRYTPKVVPTPTIVHIPPPQAGAFVSVPTTLVGSPDSSMTKGTYGNSIEEATSRGEGSD